jgi:Zn-dependent protease with chaperone function
MSKSAVLASALAGVFCLAALPGGRAQSVTLQKMDSDVYVQVHAEADGEVSMSAWSSKGGADLLPVLPEVLHCPGGAKRDPDEPAKIRCAQALRRDGLALEGVVDLAPIARRLAPSEEIQLWLNYPRMGIASLSTPMDERPERMRVIHNARFEAGSVPPPILYRFGYRPDQLASVYLPLVALALALFLLAAILSRMGTAGLSRSVVLLGTIVWMGAAAQLQAGNLLHLLLYGSPWAKLAALFVEIWPPLLCVATGVALGSWKQGARRPGNRFGEVLWGFAIIPLILTSVIGALPLMMDQNWIAAAPWLVAAPLFALLRRAWIRARAGASVKLLSSGELRERVSALVAKARRPPIKLLVSSSIRSQVSAAFTLPGKSIFLTAPLVRSLSKREVDAIVAHELAHFKNSSRGQWTALALAMVFFGTPVSGILLSLPGGLLVTTLLLLTVLFTALRGARKREFAADASAAALTADPRAMISSLARISRNNKIPLDLNPAAEWLSTHPSTRKRIQALAAAARLTPNEVESLCNSDDPGDSYELPAEEVAGVIFTPAWQKMNAGVYGWTVLLGSSAAGLVVAVLLYRTVGVGPMQLLGGIALGCLLTKAMAATVMSTNYARLGRKLEAKFGVRGQIVGLAIDSDPRMYAGRRFSDAGLLWFAGGRLCYRSERTTIELNPANVVEVRMIAASPANWFRLVPMVRFRQPESSEPNSGELAAFILHPLSWLAANQRLFHSIERWRTTQTSAEATSTSGFHRIASQPFQKIPVLSIVPAFGISIGAALLPAIPVVFLLHTGWGFIAYALVLTGCAHIFTILPIMLSRPPAHSAEPMPAQAQSDSSQK